MAKVSWLAMTPRAVGPLLSDSFPVLIHHLLRHILFVAYRRCSTRLTVCAPSTTHSARSINAVRTGAAPLVARNRLPDNLLPDLRVGLLSFLRLGCGDSEREDQNDKTG